MAPSLRPPPLIYVTSLLRGCAIVLPLQIACFSAVCLLPTLHTSQSLRYALLLALYCLVLRAARAAFDPTVHVIATCLSAAVFGFSGPLFAMAQLHDRHVAAVAKSKFAPPSFARVFLRMTVPFSPSKLVDGTSLLARIVSILRGVSFCAIAANSTALVRHVRQPDARPLLRDAVALALLFLIVNGVLSMLAAMVPGATAPFSAPLLASSQATFWGGRWNSPISNALRQGVYAPLRYYNVAAPLASLAAFAASGVSHEVMLWYAFGAPDGRWLLFFLLASAGVSVEQVVLRKAGRGARSFMTRVAAWVFLVPIFRWTFVPPLVLDSRILIDVIDELAYLQTIVLQVVGSSKGAA